MSLSDSNSHWLHIIPFQRGIMRWDEAREMSSVKQLSMNFSPLSYLQYLFLCIVFNEKRWAIIWLPGSAGLGQIWFEFSSGLYQLQRDPKMCKGIWGAANPHPAELILWKEKNPMDKRRWKNKSGCNPACVLGKPGSSTSASPLKRLQNCIQIKTFYPQFAWVPRIFWDWTTDELCHHQRLCAVVAWRCCSFWALQLFTGFVGCTSLNQNLVFCAINQFIPILHILIVTNCSGLLLWETAVENFLPWGKSWNKIH